MDGAKILIYDKKLKFTPLEFETLRNQLWISSGCVKIYSVGV